MSLFRIVSVLLIMFSFAFSNTAAAAEAAKSNTSKEETTLTKKAAAVKPVNINTADLAALQTLKGIGPKKAQDIIDYRGKNGDFKKIDDLKSIPGFTDKFIAKLQKDNPDLIVFK